MILLDGKQMKDRNTAHEYLKVMLHFPDYYGKNLDALRDLLTDIGEETRITIEGSKFIVESLGEYGQDLLEEFKEAAEENSSLIVDIK